MNDDNLLQLSYILNYFYMDYYVNILDKSKFLTGYVIKLFNF